MQNGCTEQTPNLQHTVYLITPSLTLHCLPVVESFPFKAMLHCRKAPPPAPVTEQGQNSYGDNACTRIRGEQPKGPQIPTDTRHPCFSIINLYSACLCKTVENFCTERTRSDMYLTTPNLIVFFSTAESSPSLVTLQAGTPSAAIMWAKTKYTPSGTQAPCLLKRKALPVYAGQCRPMENFCTEKHETNHWIIRSRVFR